MYALHFGLYLSYGSICRYSRINDRKVSPAFIWPFDFAHFMFRFSNLFDFFPLGDANARNRDAIDEQRGRTENAAAIAGFWTF